MTHSEATERIYTFLACGKSPQKADAIIAFGSYHQEVAKTAAGLLIQGLGPILVCTGSTTTLTDDIVEHSEADYFADIAVGLGANNNQIIRETAATNTGENIIFSLDRLAEHGISPNSILVCAIPFHLRRIVATFAKTAPTITIIPILVPFDTNDYRTKSGLTFAQRLVGEIERLRTYPAKGFSLPVPFPDDVLEAEKVIIHS